MSECEVTIKFVELQMLFDLICNTMDFGSGFLETDDVMLMRKIAETIGVDPMVGTPTEFRGRIKHACKPAERKYQTLKPEFAHRFPGYALGSAAYDTHIEIRCGWCGASPEDPIHKVDTEEERG